MKLVKAQVVLYMYENMVSTGALNPVYIMEKFELEEKTLQRYINEIRAYFVNLSIPKELVYSQRQKAYLLIDERQ